MIYDLIIFIYFLETSEQISNNLPQIFAITPEYNSCPLSLPKMSVLNELK